MSCDLVEAYLRAAELHSARSRDMAATAWRVTVLCWSLIVAIPAFLLANEAPDPAITAGAVAVIVAVAAVHLFMFLPASYNGTASEQKYYVYMRNKALEAAGDAACRIGNRRGEAVADLEPVAKRKIWASGVYHVQLVTTGGLVAAACVALLTR